MLPSGVVQATKEEMEETDLTDFGPKTETFIGIDFKNWIVIIIAFIFICCFIISITWFKNVSFCGYRVFVHTVC